MSERMHPEDLRAIVAAITGTDIPAQDGWAASAVGSTDILLAELKRTAKPPSPDSSFTPLRESIRLKDMRARAEKAEAERNQAWREQEFWAYLTRGTLGAKHNEGLRECIDRVVKERDEALARVAELESALASKEIPHA